MNALAFFILLFVLVGAGAGLWVVASQNTTTPVDTYGNVPSQTSNRTLGNATVVLTTGMAVPPWIAFVVVVIILVAVGLWAWQSGGKNEWRSRY